MHVMTRTQLRALLQRLGLTQVGLARRLKVAPQTVRRWVGGQSPIPEAVALLLSAWVAHPHMIPTGRKGPKGTGDQRRAP